MALSNGNAAEFPLHSPLCRRLLLLCILGEWGRCLAATEAEDDLEPRAQNLTSYLILRHKFLELLGSEDDRREALDFTMGQIFPAAVRGGAKLRLLDEGDSFRWAVAPENRFPQRMGLFLELALLLPARSSGRLESFEAVDSHPGIHRPRCCY